MSLTLVGVSGARDSENTRAFPPWSCDSADRGLVMGQVGTPLQGFKLSKAVPAVMWQMGIC